MVAETGQEFYAELTDGWTEEWCSEFVRIDVLPHLTRDPGHQFLFGDLKQNVLDWLVQIGEAPLYVKIIYDADVDWCLFSQVCGNLNSIALDVQHEWFSMPSPMRRRCDDLLKQFFRTNAPRHNSLIDARGLCQAVLQTESEFRSNCR